jgi:hypothetical protein
MIAASLCDLVSVLFFDVDPQYVLDVVRLAFVVLFIPELSSVISFVFVTVGGGGGDGIIYFSHSFN